MYTARSMRPIFAATLVLGSIFSPQVAFSGARDKSIAAEALVERARSEQIWAEGTPPMQLKAELDVAGTNGTTAQGDYTFDWVSPTQWREEIHFANYERLRVRDANGYWQTGTLDYQPVLIYELSGMLYEKSVLRVRSAQTLGKVKDRKKGGNRQECVDVRWPRATDRTLCFNDAGALVGIEYPQDSYQGSPLISRIEFGSFHSVSGKLFPYEVHALSGGKMVASLKVLQITPTKVVNTALFSPPANSEFWPQCEDMQDAEVIKRAPVSRSSGVYVNGVPQKVILYAVVEADGSLSHVTVIYGFHPDLNAAMLASVRQWRYKPAQCGQTPIRVETSLSFDMRE